MVESKQFSLISTFVQFLKIEFNLYSVVKLLTFLINFAELSFYFIIIEKQMIIIESRY